MKHKIVVDPFDEKSIDKAIVALNEYKLWVLMKEKELRERLAEAGADVARVEFHTAIYDGKNDVSVTFSDDGKTATILASGRAVAFIEFGSGGLYGDGHPLNAEFGTGPGTWSDGPNGKGHWNDPNGWYYEHGKKSYGNPPAMAMVHARDKVAELVTGIAREVFSG